LKLNPTKCSFRVKYRKLLGFKVSSQGIEVDPDKVKAIQAMSVSKTEKEVRGFLGRLNYIVWFISQMTATCEPIFRLFQKKILGYGTWNAEKLSIKSSSICKIHLCWFLMFLVNR